MGRALAHIMALAGVPALLLACNAAGRDKDPQVELLVTPTPTRADMGYMELAILTVIVLVSVVIIVVVGVVQRRGR